MPIPLYMDEDVLYICVKVVIALYAFIIILNASHLGYRASVKQVQDQNLNLGHVVPHFMHIVSINIGKKLGLRGLTPCLPLLQFLIYQRARNSRTRRGATRQIRPALTFRELTVFFHLFTASQAHGLLPPWVDGDDGDAEEPTRKKEIASPSTSEWVGVRLASVTEFLSFEALSESLPFANRVPYFNREKGVKITLPLGHSRFNIASRGSTALHHTGIPYS
ncbi:hypothetical protein Syun_001904 [Stephania yunnanensis]|uniref:Uncharacterized protein n=1 Tax=Stephania yunnanensis TaxID=152371 RepID=A0AAP0Q894_9MAGN